MPDSRSEHAVAIQYASDLTARQAALTVYVQAHERGGTEGLEYGCPHESYSLVSL